MQKLGIDITPQNHSIVMNYYTTCMHSLESNVRMSINQARAGDRKGSSPSIHSEMGGVKTPPGPMTPRPMTPRDAAPSPAPSSNNVLSGGGADVAVKDENQPNSVSEAIIPSIHNQGAMDEVVEEEVKAEDQTGETNGTPQQAEPAHPHLPPGFTPKKRMMNSFGGIDLQSIGSLLSRPRPQKELYGKEIHCNLSSPSQSIIT
jgi:hypothetical protein